MMNMELGVVRAARWFLSQGTRTTLSVSLLVCLYFLVWMIWYIYWGSKFDAGAGVKKKEFQVRESWVTLRHLQNTPVGTMSKSDARKNKKRRQFYTRAKHYLLKEANWENYQRSQSINIRKSRKKTSRFWYHRAKVTKNFREKDMIKINT